MSSEPGCLCFFFLWCWGLNPRPGSYRASCLLRGYIPAPAFLFLIPFHIACGLGKPADLLRSHSISSLPLLSHHFKERWGREAFKMPERCWFSRHKAAFFRAWACAWFTWCFSSWGLFDLQQIPGPLCSSAFSLSNTVMLLVSHFIFVTIKGLSYPCILSNNYITISRCLLPLEAICMCDAVNIAGK